MAPPSFGGLGIDTVSGVVTLHPKISRALHKEQFTESCTPYSIRQAFALRRMRGLQNMGADLWRSVHETGYPLGSLLAIVVSAFSPLTSGISLTNLWARLTSVWAPLLQCWVRLGDKSAEETERREAVKELREREQGFESPTSEG